MWIFGLAVGFSVGALMISAGAAALAAWCMIEVMAFRKSTHQVQFVSADEAAKEAADDAEIRKAYDKMMSKHMDMAAFKDEDAV